MGFGGSTTASSTGIDGTLSVKVVGRAAFITRAGGSDVTKSIEVTLALTGVVSPIFAGTTGNVDLELLTSKSALIDSFNITLGVSVVPGNITDALLTASDYKAFEFNNYTFTLSLGAVGLPPASDIDLVFPDGIDIRGGILSRLIGVDGTQDLSCASRTCTITRLTGSYTAALSQITIVISNVRNNYEGSSGTFRVLTRSTATQLLMEYNLDIPSITFLLNVLVINSIFVGSTLTGSQTHLSISATTAGAFNLDNNDGGIIEIRLPPGFLFHSSSQ
eukprot:3937709-Rhodomonas_salina.1